MLVVDYLPSPPVGLITPDALSLCLFTLVQQLGHERVNEASGPPRPGLVQATGKCAVFTDHVRPRWVLREGGGLQSDRCGGVGRCGGRGGGGGEGQQCYRSHSTALQQANEGDQRKSD